MGHFQAKGHGPYPFWQFGPPVNDWIVNRSFDTPFLYKPGNDMEVWHNTLRRATKFYHSACEWAWLGFSDLASHPCVGLMLDAFGPNGTWYLYTADPVTKATDERFCCDSTWLNFNGLHLGTINRKFVEELVYVGEADFVGDYYSGRSRRYMMAMDFENARCPECGYEPVLPINVFYETDLQGRPLRFGEWGQNLDFDGYLHDTDLPLLYEEMDPESFTNGSMQNFSDLVFDVPSICLTDLHSCHPGRLSRENAASQNENISFGNATLKANDTNEESAGASVGYFYP